MTTPLLLFVLTVALVLQIAPVASQFDNSSIPIVYEAKVIESSNGTCPTAEDREAAQNEIRSDIQRLLNPHIYGYTCGGTDGWARIAYLNMSNTSHQCPGDLRETSRSVGRLCGRGLGFYGSAGSKICKSAIFPSNGIRYSEVCGRVVAYQQASAYAFSGGSSIEEYYADGVSLTHGPVGARKHIWNFVITHNNAIPSTATRIPSFIGENYFCESGSNGSGYRVFYDEPLWDGDGCFLEGNNCCTFNNPPYFTRQLPTSTNDDIELRDCMFSSYYGADTLIQLIELYIK